MKIGEVASTAGVNVQTVRFYEREGLIPEPDRTASGYRQYPDDTPHRIRFIKRAQELGFSLKEIQELLALRVDSEESCHAVEDRTRDKIRIVEQKIGELTAMKKTLERLVASCEAKEPTGDCPVLEMLERKSMDDA